MGPVTINGELFDYEINRHILNGLVVNECIISPSGINTTEFYQIDLTISNDGTPLITNLQNYKFPLVSGKGLAEVFIEILNSYVGGGLKSSSNNLQCHKIVGEFRTESATRIWEKLLSNGLAIYDIVEDRYIFVSPIKN